jgi:hypothetical protein
MSLPALRIAQLVHYPKSKCNSSDDTEARHSLTAQVTEREQAYVRSRPTAKDDSGKSGGPLRARLAISDAPR